VLVDTHCHLYWESFKGALPAVLESMEDAGVIGAIVVGIDARTNAQASRLAREHPQLRYSAGLHPSEQFPDEVKRGGSFDVESYLSGWWEQGPAPVAVGECGIDLHWDTNAIEPQMEVFTAQLRFARERDLPVIVHSRDADEETRDALRQIPGARGILHCFNGSRLLLDFAHEANARADAWYVSFAGNMTYPKAGNLRDAAREVPLERLLVETDAPWMAPQPRRGKRNEPAFVVHTAQALAELRGISESEMNVRLLENSRACFGVEW
jgi:TatD DNase family protein